MAIEYEKLIPKKNSYQITTEAQLLTKRELFAAMAMIGIAANPEFSNSELESDIKSAIDYADVLIEELNK